MNPLYDIWKFMIRRCSDPTFKDWHLYGGKNPPVTVCERWLNSYEDFEKDMGKRPSKSHTLDRIESSGNYEPGNCKWSTPKEQSRNMSRNRHIEFGGITLTLAEWAERCGLKYMTLFCRLKNGWPIKEALFTRIGSFNGIRGPRI